MRILVGKTFGIGNTLLSVPLLKALKLLGHRVDVLVGTGPDDVGAVETMTYFMENHGLSPQSLFTDQVPEGISHDVAIMAIPFDGRWKNGVHYSAGFVMDERRRPENVDRLGFDMWKKHEVEYQLENAAELGFMGMPAPVGMIDEKTYPQDVDRVYLGIGYKRDSGGFGFSKHYGNENYCQLMRAIRKLRPSVKFVSTGTVMDLMEVGYKIHQRLFSISPMQERFYSCKASSLLESIRTIQTSAAYLGNDTGMMHMAAALGVPTYGLFAHRDLLVKNPPYTARGKALLFSPNGPSPEGVAEDFVSFVWG